MKEDAYTFLCKPSQQMECGPGETQSPALGVVTGSQAGQDVCVGPDLQLCCLSTEGGWAWGDSCWLFPGPGRAEGLYLPCNHGVHLQHFVMFREIRGLLGEPQGTGSNLCKSLHITCTWQLGNGMLVPFAKTPRDAIEVLVSGGGGGDTIAFNQTAETVIVGAGMMGQLSPSSQGNLSSFPRLLL